MVKKLDVEKQYSLVALKELPNFTCRPNVGKNPMPHHQANIHINCESMDIIQQAYEDFREGIYSKRY